MPRALRVQEPGLYHVGSRGNNGQQIFDDALRKIFLFQLTLVARSFAWDVYAWALMSNHFHLLLGVHDDGLAAGMHRLNLGFARASNAHFDRVDHCVGNRYWNGPIETDAHLYACVRYVLWNPVRAAVVDDPFDSTWTSARSSAGLELREPLALGRLLPFFGNTTALAQAELRDFVLAGRERCLQPWLAGLGIVR
jgi:REP element-mobilizing transposase RayT